MKGSCKFSMAKILYKGYRIFLQRIYIACLHDQNKSGFLEGRLFSSQSELFENFLDCSDWLDKSWSSKKATFI